MTMLELLPYLVFFTLLGLCVGSFLNVVVYRLPLGKSLIHPPSTCPRCNTRLAWYDNIPVLGWLKLKGKCRYCRNPISVRYPLVEGAVGLMFLGYTVGVFYFGLGPCVYNPGPLVSSVGIPIAPPMAEMTRDWPMLLMHLMLFSALFAASLIDLETFTIPLSISVFIAAVGLLSHTLLMGRTTTGALLTTPGLALPTLLASVGYVVGMGLLYTGVLRRSFPNGEVMDETDVKLWHAEIEAAKAENRPPNVLDPNAPPKPLTRRELNYELAVETLFCLFALAPFVVGLMLLRWMPAALEWSQGLAENPYMRGLLGSAFGGLCTAGVFAFVRIGFSFLRGRIAMGYGDIQLMAAIGTVTGAMIGIGALFVSAFYGLAFHLYGYLRGRGSELPLGPYLAMATGTLLLFACQYDHAIQTYLEFLRGPAVMP